MPASWIIHTVPYVANGADISQLRFSEAGSPIQVKSLEYAMGLGVGGYHDSPDWPKLSSHCHLRHSREPDCQVAGDSMRNSAIRNWTMRLTMRLGLPAGCFHDRWPKGMHFPEINIVDQRLTLAIQVDVLWFSCRWSRNS